MAAKDRREQRSYARASEARNSIITRLEDCNSYKRLEEILSSMKRSQANAQSPLKIGGLTPHHTSMIQAQDLQIKQLIQAKKAQFPKPEVVLAETKIEITEAVSVEPLTTDSDEESEANDEVVITVENDTDKEAIKTVIFTEEASHSERSLSVDASDYDLGKNTPSNEYSGQSDYLSERSISTSTNRFYRPLKTNSDEFNHERAQEIVAVRDQLMVLNAKRIKLSDISDKYRDNNQMDDAKTYRRATNAAGVIHTNLSLLCSDYEHNKIDLNTFKSMAQLYLNNENKDVITLNTHRGYKDVIANLLIAITGIGLLAIAAASIYNGRLTMFSVTQTATGANVNSLNDAVEHVRPVPTLS
ncbi:hypothetical protein [uncultured Legionella sp.]|uniref:hypothetical protein n=1 Tax=uncultured Legionella sp. TaxID=210934 RepID=UPI00261C4F73|nr:hypothetical protein [uncultured Legionella sp.]